MNTNKTIAELYAIARQAEETRYKTTFDNIADYEEDAGEYVIDLSDYNLNDLPQVAWVDEYYYGVEARISHVKRLSKYQGAYYVETEEEDHLMGLDSILYGQLEFISDFICEL